MKTYVYTKDDGSTSDRVLHIVSKPPAQNFRALDLTAFEPEVRQRIVDLHAQWQQTVEKPYRKSENEFREENLLSFEAYLTDQGIKTSAPAVKSFKASGLVEVA